jgi:hypothetical protein
MKKGFKNFMASLLVFVLLFSSSNAFARSLGLENQDDYNLIIISDELTLDSQVGLIIIPPPRPWMPPPDWPPWPPNVGEPSPWDSSPSSL